jgi:hypothetical protein
MFLPRSLRQRENQLRDAGFSKTQAREWLRRPPCKYGGPLVGLNRAVMFTYIERVEVSDTAGGAGREDAEADKK